MTACCNLSARWRSYDFVVIGGGSAGYSAAAAAARSGLKTVCIEGGDRSRRALHPPRLYAEQSVDRICKSFYDVAAGRRSLD